MKSISSSGIVLSNLRGLAIDEVEVLPPPALRPCGLPRARDGLSASRNRGSESLRELEWREVRLVTQERPSAGFQGLLPPDVDDPWAWPLHVLERDRQVEGVPRQ